MKKRARKTAIDPYIHLNKALLVGMVAITAAAFIVFVYWFAILHASDQVIIEPVSIGWTELSRYIPYTFFKQSWEQQKELFQLLKDGFIELLRTMGMRV